MRRAIGFHFVQSYLPTTLIVVISWVSFWMDVDSVPGRTTLGVTTLLTVSSKSSGIQAGLPQVSYVKAIDVWMGACTAFVFCALLEFTFVNYLWRRRPRGELRARGDPNGDCKPVSCPQAIVTTPAEPKSVIASLTTPTGTAPSPVPPADGKGSPGHEDPAQFARAFKQSNKIRARQIDEYCRGIFPLLFSFFNIFYWCYYLL
ncbi:glycine receptor subunit beta-type 4-like [Penaeus japonicus]|uniref:glycine receptor subunit beta-type 4-like n=1 Tax=Penaeus japonicus TaxID=27405 RepID=UPI001C711CEE|nr:glycine receptor subunit beta-type 4-like [Penaeus japonicus]